MEGEENNQGSDRHRGRLGAPPPSGGEVTQQGKARIRRGRLVMEKVLHMGWRKKIKNDTHVSERFSCVHKEEDFKETAKRIRVTT